MLDLGRVRDRDELCARREPYWHRLRPGCFVGYRPSRKGGDGTWIARVFDGDRRIYCFKALGALGEVQARERFAAAKQQAESFAMLVDGGGFSDQRVETVRDACRLYAGTNAEVEARFRRHVYDDPIAKIPLTKLRRSQLRAWRDRLKAKPVLTGRPGNECQDRLRSPATINRDMAMLRAALNRVLPSGVPNTEADWQQALKPIRNADRNRTVYLDREQRRQLLQSVGPEAEPFVRTLCFLPLRPGAVARLRVSDFDARTAELSIGKDKSGKQRRLLLPSTVAELFAAQAHERPLHAALFTRSNGKPWDKESWKGPIARAAGKAKLPQGATAYALRHSTITDLVNGGLPLLTVAQISDTSAEMIERHYGHLNCQLALQALAGLAL